MTDILELIYQKVHECTEKKELFHLPSEVRPYVVTHEESQSGIAESWRIEKGEQWLVLDYKSVERYSSFGNKPDRSHLSIKGEILEDGKMTSKNDYLSWDEAI